MAKWEKCSSPAGGSLTQTTDRHPGGQESSQGTEKSQNGWFWQSRNGCRDGRHLIEKEHIDLWLEKILLMTQVQNPQYTQLDTIFVKHQASYKYNVIFVDPVPPRQLSAACSCRVTIDPYWPLLHCALFSVLHCALYCTVHCTVYCTVHCTALFTVHCVALCTVHYTVLYTNQFSEVYTVQCTALCTVQCCPYFRGPLIKPSVQLNYESEGTCNLTVQSWPYSQRELAIQQYRVDHTVRGNLQSYSTELTIQLDGTCNLTVQS